MIFLFFKIVIFRKRPSRFHPWAMVNYFVLTANFSALPKILVVLGREISVFWRKAFKLKPTCKGICFFAAFITSELDIEAMQ